MPKRAVDIDLSEAERIALTSLAVRRNTAQALALRARIVLACAEGEQNKRVAAALDVDVDTVGKWRRRPAGMQHAIPGFASWQLATLPRFLVAEDVERLIASCSADAAGP